MKRVFQKDISGFQKAYEPAPGRYQLIAKLPTPRSAEISDTLPAMIWLLGAILIAVNAEWKRDLVGPPVMMALWYIPSYIAKKLLPTFSKKIRIEFDDQGISWNGNRVNYEEGWASNMRTNPVAEAEAHGKPRGSKYVPVQVVIVAGEQFGRILEVANIAAFDAVDAGAQLVSAIRLLAAAAVQDSLGGAQKVGRAGMVNVRSKTRLIVND